MADHFRYDLIPPGAKVLCALSGGADSMYLLCRLMEGAKRGGYAVCAAHFNHGLRSTAGRDEEFVRQWCQARAIALTVGRGDVRGLAAQEGLSIEAAARELRYGFLKQTARAEGCALIATGHHAGDQAETVLMNLIRGSGLKGLTGIPEWRENIIRPMLAVSRPEIEAYLSAGLIPHVEDETNGEDAYTRNKVRHQLIPLLEELNPRAVEHIAAAAARLRDDEAELSRQAAGLAEQGKKTGDGITVSAALLSDAPRPVALRALARLTEQAGGTADARQLDGLLALCGAGKRSGRLDLSGCTAWRAYERLLFSAHGEPDLPDPVTLTEGENRWGRWVIVSSRAVCPAKAYISPEEFYLKDGDYLIRSRREGDAVRLGRRPAKTVKKLMIERRIPRYLRPMLPVLAAEEKTAAAGGLGPDRDALALPGEPCWHIKIKKEKEDHASRCGTNSVQ